MSESVSSFSQESPPSRTGRSPQQPSASSLMPSPVTAVEPQIRGAGFYQDALSTGSSPYNSPYYTTPPRYSAQLPPTPSPQHHPLSPAYPSSFDQAAVAPPSLYSQISPLHKPSPQAQSPSAYSQQSPQAEQSFAASTIVNPASTQSQSPVYPQQVYTFTYLTREQFLSSNFLNFVTFYLGILMSQILDPCLNMNKIDRKGKLFYRAKLL